MEYGKILSRAWEIIWKHKVLWIFGIFASLGNASSSTGSSGGNFTYKVDETPLWMDNLGWQLQDEALIPIICAAVLVGLLIMALLIFLAAVGKIGLIRGVWQVEQGAERLSFGELFRSSTPYFWRVFGLYFLVILAVVLIFIVLAVPLAITVVGLICLICLAIPFFWLLFTVLELAANAIVLENTSALDGLKRGWEVTRANLGNVIVLGLILAVISFTIGLVIGLPLLLASVPLILTAMGAGQEQWAGMGIFLACMCLYIPFLIVLSGILQSYLGSAWTLAYLQLTKRTSAIEPIVETPMLIS